MLTPSITSPTQMTRSDRLSDVTYSMSAHRTGILTDVSEGEFKHGCECLRWHVELSKAFNGIDVVTSTMHEWSDDSRVTDNERDEIIVNLPRCLWNLHIHRA